ERRRSPRPAPLGHVRVEPRRPRRPRPGRSAVRRRRPGTRLPVRPRAGDRGGMTVSLGSIVGGVVRGGAETSPDLNPAQPDTHVAVVSLAGPETAAEAVAAAAAAFAAWRDTP